MDWQTGLMVWRTIKYPPPVILQEGQVSSVRNKCVPYNFTLPCGRSHSCPHNAIWVSQQFHAGTHIVKRGCPHKAGVTIMLCMCPHNVWLILNDAFVFADQCRVYQTSDTMSAGWEKMLLKMDVWKQVAVQNKVWFILSLLLGMLLMCQLILSRDLCTLLLSASCKMNWN